MWILWQQALLITVTLSLLFIHTVGTYLTVHGRSLQRALLNLIGVTAFTTILWLASVVGYFLLLAENLVQGTTRLALVEHIYSGTLGLPFNLPDVLPGIPEFFLQLSVRRVMAWITLPTGLFFVGLLVIVAERVLRKTRIAIDAYRRQYLGGSAAAMMAFLLVIMWPRPLRNPEMPTVPLPNNTLSVTYSHTEGAHAWPVTHLTTDVMTNAQRSHYYSEVTAAGWHRENGPDAGYDSSSDDIALFANVPSQKLLRIDYQYGPEVTITIKDVTQKELASLSAAPLLPANNIPLAAPTNTKP